MPLIELSAAAGGNLSAPMSASEEKKTEFTAQVHAICAELDTLDNEIANLEQQASMLPATLAALAGHPVLWLLVGRAGVDRPGDLGGLVGQQVVTVTRRDRRALIIVGVLALLVGLAIDFGLSLWFGGMR
jgi:hypothetical protein